MTNVKGMSLNQVLAKNLQRIMAERGLTDVELGAMAHVAPNTIGNYRKGASGDRFTISGKERSARLAEIERVAEALGVHPLHLLTDPQEHEAAALRLARLIVQGSSGGTPPLSGAAT